MRSLCDRLAKATSVPVIGGVTVAPKIVEALISVDYVTSKVNAYDPHRQKSQALVATELRLRGGEQLKEDED